MTGLDKQHVPLYISIFSPRENWTKILADLIKPFFDLLNAGSSIVKVWLEFNYTSGKNIRLTIWVENGRKEQIAAMVDDKIKNYLNGSVLAESMPEIPPNGLFLPFPSNTVQYGLYKVYSDIDKDRINQTLSRCILDVFADSQVEDESVITLAFYLYSCIYNALKVAGEELDPEDIFAVPGEKSFVYDFSETEGEELLSILNECYNQTLPAELKWLQNWKKECNAIAAKFNGKTGCNIKKINALLSESVDRHLGLTNEILGLLAEMLKVATKAHEKNSILKVI